MPESTESMPADPAPAHGAMLVVEPPREQDDIALGWESACPALQIDRWQQEAGAADVH